MAKPTPNGDTVAPRLLVNLDSAPDPQPGQVAVYRLYIHLQSIATERFAGSLAGKLLLNIGFDLRGSELALATTIAGGAFLGIEPDPQLLKAAVRNGSCDFMVNTLDESLRVLKNELRKRTALSAGLLGHASEILPAMLERGVQPDLYVSPSPEACNPMLDRFSERGAEMLPQTWTTEAAMADEVTWTAANPQDLRRIDKIALDRLPPEDQVRRRWLEQAAGSFYRQIPRQRVICMRGEERELLVDALRSGTSAPFHSPAEIRWRNADGTEQVVSI